MTDTKAGEQRTCMSVACRGIVIVDWTSACGSETVELLCGHCRECDRLQVYDERRKVSGKTGELAEEVDLSTCRVCECGVHYPNGMEPTGICHPCEIGELSARVAQLEAELKEAKADAERDRTLLQRVAIALESLDLCPTHQGIWFLCPPGCALRMDDAPAEQEEKP